MKESERVRASKRLSRYLRHAPAEIGVTLDSAGWVEIDVLLAALAANGPVLTRPDLMDVVAGSDKQRFAVEGGRIRANQGHSVAVVLDLPEATPPPVLYHGTVERFLPAIRREGLRPMQRHDVHLSATVDTATRVGGRRGRPFVLAVDSAGMCAAAHIFRVSANGVWLTSAVPPAFLRELDDRDVQSLIAERGT